MATDASAWHEGGWDGHRRAQAETWRATSPEQRLAWLEVAIAFAHEVGALPRPPTPMARDDGRIDGRGG